MKEQNKINFLFGLLDKKISDEELMQYLKELELEEILQFEDE